MSRIQVARVKCVAERIMYNTRTRTTRGRPIGGRASATCDRTRLTAAEN